MTYLQFHLVFTLPPLLALSLLQGRTRQPWWPLAALVAIAYVYTTPWDNLLVAWNIWSYPPDRVLARIGYVPVEEYAFFGIQTVMTGLWTRLLQARSPIDSHPDSTLGIRATGATVFLVLAILGAIMLVAGGSWLYMGLIVAWACPVLSGMWWLGGHLIWARRQLVAWAVIPTTLYLWAADWYAITQAGIWNITDATRTGWEIVGLPVEEALFFLVTNLLVVKGLVMWEKPERIASS
ncbi:MAG: lycopene cyclase domain-containing protein [Bacteroidota bacterium]